MGRLPWLADGPLPLYLAPMAGFTDRAFRQICKEFGADVMVTEFVHAEKFLHERSEEDAWRTVDFCTEQRPMGVQIFGGDAWRMAEAARRIVDRLQPDFLDINYGCPSPRVVNSCAGSSLLREPDKLAGIAAAVVRAVGHALPVTAKIRIGWDASSINALDNARRLVDCGIEALAIHGRTKEQGYSGDANWEVIHAVAEAISIPVIGNGSLREPQRLLSIRDAGKVKAVMIGRAALGNPWIFRELKAVLQGWPVPAPPSTAERWDLLTRYAGELLAHHGHGAWEPLQWMRPRLISFLQDFAGAKALRAKVERVRTLDDLQALRAAVDSHFSTEKHLVMRQGTSIATDC